MRAAGEAGRETCSRRCHGVHACISGRSKSCPFVQRSNASPALTHECAAHRAKADSWAGQGQTKFWQAWAHVAYRVQYSRYLAFYLFICAGLGER